MARRKHDEGSVFQRKDGRWVAQVRLENGKKKQRYFKPDQEKEARVALRKMLNEKEQGKLSTGPQQTLKVYLEQWLEQVHKPTVRIITYKSYRIMLDNHIIPVLGHVQLQKLTAQQVQAFYTIKLNEGLSPGRIKGLHMVLHGALANAVKWELITKNVCDLVTLPIGKRYEAQPLTPEQAQRLLDAAKEHKLETLLVVAVITGMRRGELLGLHWQDIDFDEKCLYVRRSVVRVGKLGLIESEPKTRLSKRKIMLPTFVLDALKHYQEYQQVMREQAGTQWEEKGIVFCNARGGYLSESTLQGSFKRLLKRAGLPNIRLHDLRHGAASFLAMLGVHPKVVQEILGHSNIGMTMDVYSHLFPSMQQEAMEKLGKLFKSDEEKL
jgi:integrase